MSALAVDGPGNAHTSRAEDDADKTADGTLNGSAPVLIVDWEGPDDPANAKK